MTITSVPPRAIPRRQYAVNNAPVPYVAPPKALVPVLGKGKRTDGQRKRKRRRALMHPLPTSV